MDFISKNMITIEKLKNNLNNWLVTFDSRNKLRTIQKIDEVIPQNYGGVVINGPIIEFFDTKIIISKDSQSRRYFSSELSKHYNRIMTEEEFENNIGKIIFENFRIKL